MPRYEQINDPALIAELNDRVAAANAGVDYEKASRSRSYKQNRRNAITGKPQSGFQIGSMAEKDMGIGDRFINGMIVDPVSGLAQALTHGANSLQRTLGMDPNRGLFGGEGAFSDNEVAYQDAQAKIRSQRMGAAQEARGGGTDYARLAGSFFTPVPPVAKVAKLGRGGNALLQGAVQGGVAAGLQPVVDGGDNFGRSKLSQVTTGAAFGGAANYGLDRVARMAGRGGNASTLEQRLVAGERNGIDLSLSEASDNNLLRASTDVMSNLPGGGSLVRNARRNAEKFDSVAESAASDTGNVLSRTEMGGNVSSGLRGFVSRFENQSNRMYGDIDRHVSPGTQVDLSATRKAMLDTIEGFPSNPKIGELLTNPRLTKLANELTDDAGNAKQLFFTETQRLRSEIGKMLGQPEIMNDIPRRELAKVYAALTSDMRNSLAGNPNGLKAFDRATQFYKAGRNRIQSVIEPILNTNSDERAADKVLNMLANDAKGTRALRKSLTPDEWDDVAASIFAKLGDEGPGQAGANGGFSIPKFLTDFNKLKQNKEAFDWAFGGTRYEKLRDTYGDLAIIADSIKQSKKLSNPSRSGYTGGLIGLGTLIITAPQVAAKAVGGNYIMSRLMASPKFARWMVKSAKIVNRGLSGGGKAAEMLMKAHVAKLPAIAAANSDIADGVDKLYAYMQGDK